MKINLSNGASDHSQNIFGFLSFSTIQTKKKNAGPTSLKDVRTAQLKAELQPKPFCFFECDGVEALSCFYLRETESDGKI